MRKNYEYDLILLNLAYFFTDIFIWVTARSFGEKCQPYAIFFSQYNGNRSMYRYTHICGDMVLVIACIHTRWDTSRCDIMRRVNEPGIWSRIQHTILFLSIRIRYENRKAFIELTKSIRNENEYHDCGVWCE